MLEEDLLRVVEESWIFRKFSRGLNEAFILIRMKNELDSFDDYITISFFKFVYKIISKIIKNRLKKLLLGVISKEQFGFIFNRKIHDVFGSSHKECNQQKWIKLQH